MHDCEKDGHKLAGDICPVIREFRLIKTPEGKEQLRGEYRDQLRARLDQITAGDSVDWPLKLQQLGVALDLIQALKNKRKNMAMEWAEKFLQADRAETRMLVLAGPRGIGKSVAAGYVLQQAVKRFEWNSQASGGKQRQPFYWVKGAEITAETDFGKVNPDWMEGLRFARLLVLDDLGQEATQPGIAALRDLMIFRYEKRKATILTSNMAPSDFLERYGPSWFHRMAACALVPNLAKEKSLRNPKRFP